MHAFKILNGSQTGLLIADISGDGKSGHFVVDRNRETLDLRCEHVVGDQQCAYDLIPGAVA